ncbi:MAG: hypothetical protein J0I07_02605 [Myxococcales bacterium]|nr:hypothetical protein [Myxococcales bacterium]
MSRRNELSSSWRRALGGVAVIAVLLVPASALAEVEPVAIRYETTGACPSESEFLSEVRGYTTLWSPVPEGTTAARTIRVRVTVGPSETVGTLAVANSSGVISERDIVGPNCTAVSRALAVMVAVAIDPHAGEANERHPDESASTAEPDAERVPPTSDRLAPPQHPKEASPPIAGPRVTLDLRVEATSAVVRGSLTGIGMSTKLELPETTGPRWLREWKPSLGIGIRQSFPQERKLSGGSVEFLWTAGHLRVCPFRIALGGVAEVSPCAEMNIGRLHASADGFPDARGASTFWLDLGGSVWAAVNLSKRVFFSSTVLVTAPVTRQPFALASGASVSTAPALGLLGGIGVGATF